MRSVSVGRGAGRFGLRFGSSVLPAVVALLASCAGLDSRTDETSDYSDTDFRAEMRTLVIGIAEYARARDPDFVVIPQNGQELLTADGEAAGALSSSYAAAIDGVGREDLFYGYNGDDRATPSDETSYMVEYLERAERAGIEVLVTDYCETEARVNDSYARNSDLGFISFAADRRDLDSIPSIPSVPNGSNTNEVAALSDAANFLYLINPGNYTNGADLTADLSGTNYDLFIVDLFSEDGLMLTESQVGVLQSKPTGARRLVIAYMSIGEAEDYRYYWTDSFADDWPGWVVEENPDWPGNFKVTYWDEDWKALLYGSPDAYLDRIVAAGFDGVYLDIIDGFEYFEELQGR